MFKMGRGHKDEQSEQHAGQDSQQPTAPAQSSQTGTMTAAEAAAAGGRPAVEKSTLTSKAVTEAESLAREIKEGTMSGFVGGSTSLTGQASFKGMLRIDGHLSGSITSEKGTLIVSSGGRVDANIEVGVARINGTVNGDIVATERIELGRTAHLNGNIQTPALVVEQGATFEGNCRMTKLATAQPAVESRSSENRQPANNNAPRVAATGKPAQPAAATTTNAAPPPVRNAPPVPAAVQQHDMSGATPTAS